MLPMLECRALGKSKFDARLILEAPMSAVCGGESGMKFSQFKNFYFLCLGEGRQAIYYAAIFLPKERVGT